MKSPVPPTIMKLPVPPAMMMKLPVPPTMMKSPVPPAMMMKSPVPPTMMKSPVPPAMPPQPVLLLAFAGLEALAEGVDGHALASRSGDDVLLGAVVGRDGNVILRRVSDREALDDVVGRLTSAGVNDLKPGGWPLLGQRRPPSVEHDDDSVSREITILGEAPHQFGISSPGDAALQIEELAPSVDDVVPVDQ